jgi:NitT/TauT family transport system substrate-binding protein
MARWVVEAAALACILAATLPACSKPPGPAPLKRLSVGALPYLSYGPLFIAQDEGFFTEQGLEVEFGKAVRSAEMLPTLAAGRLDALAGTISTSLVNAIERQATIKLVASKGHVNESGCAAHGLIARSDLIDSGKLKAIADLKGLRVAIPRGSWSRYYVELLLRRVGLGLDDIQILDVPDSVVPGAMDAGTLDVASASEPWLTMMEQQRIGKLWISAQKILPGFHHGMIAYGPNLLVRDQDAGRRFMIAFLKGVRRFNEGKTPRNVEILAKHTNLDPKLIRNSCWSVYDPDGNVNVDSLLEFQKWAHANRLVDRELPADALWDPSFARYAAGLLSAAGPGS